MEKQDVKIGTWLQEGFEIYKNNILLLIVINLLAVLLGAVTFGILAGPMMAGVVLVTLGLIDKQEPKPEIGGVFKGFEFFLDAFLFVLAWGIVHILANVLVQLVFNPFIAIVLQFIISIVIQTFAVFGLFLIVDKKMDFWNATVTAVNLVKKSFVPLALVLLVASVLSSVGGFACGIGVFVTMPFYACVMAVVYRDMIRNAVNPVVA